MELSYRFPVLHIVSTFFFLINSLQMYLISKYLGERGDGPADEENRESLSSQRYYVFILVAPW